MRPKATILALQHAAKSLAVLIGVCVLSTTANAFPAIVLSCHDADTCTVFTADRHKIHVRFADIDAPEVAPDGGQPYGDIGHSDLVKLIMGQTVNVIPRGLDRYGRTIATVWFGRLDVNEALVQAGDAWVYGTYNADPAMPVLEAEARAAGRGLWADPNPEAPWQWRREHRH